MFIKCITYEFQQNITHGDLCDKHKTENFVEENYFCDSIRTL